MSLEDNRVTWSERYCMGLADGGRDGEVEAWTNQRWRSRLSSRWVYMVQCTYVPSVKPGSVLEVSCRGREEAFEDKM